MGMRQILACLLLATLGRTSLADTCTVPASVVVVVTPPGAELDEDGGAVVALGPQTNEDQPEMTDIGRLRWHFGGEGALDDVIGPGLAVVHSQHHGDALEDSGGDVKMHVKWREHKPALPAPAVTSIVSDKTATTLALAAPPPADAVAVLVNLVDNPVAPPTWARITDPKAATVTLETRTHCAWAIPGNAMSRAGTKVVISWLDSSGRYSTASKPVTIVQH
jgi:hypothetical protein